MNCHVWQEIKVKETVSGVSRKVHSIDKVQRSENLKTANKISKSIQHHVDQDISDLSVPDKLALSCRHWRSRSPLSFISWITLSAASNFAHSVSCSILLESSIFCFSRHWIFVDCCLAWSWAAASSRWWHSHCWRISSFSCFSARRSSSSSSSSTEKLFC